MDDETVRQAAEGFCAALVAGDVERATEDLSTELQRNLGEVVALLPLPATEGVVESVERSGPGFNVRLQLVGETESVVILTRWKDRDDRATIVELSHESATPIVVEPDADADGEAGGDAGNAADGEPGGASS